PAATPAYRRRPGSTPQGAARGPALAGVTGATRREQGGKEAGGLPRPSVSELERLPLALLRSPKHLGVNGFAEVCVDASPEVRAALLRSPEVLGVSGFDEARVDGDLEAHALGRQHLPPVRDELLVRLPDLPNLAVEIEEAERVHAPVVLAERGVPVDLIGDRV